MKPLQLYYDCWLEVLKHQRYHDKWLTDETYCRAIKAQFPTVMTLWFDRGKLNRAIATHDGTALDDFTESNRSKDWTSGKGAHDEEDGKGYKGGKGYEGGKGNDDEEDDDKEYKGNKGDDEDKRA